MIKPLPDRTSIGQDPHQLDAHWPERLRELAIALRETGVHTQNRPLLATFWPLLIGALLRYVRFHARHRGNLSPDLAYDLAAEKALDLLRQLDSRQWRPEAFDQRQLLAFLSATARNGVTDHFRREGRFSQAPPPATLNPRTRGDLNADSAEVALARRQYVTALYGCLRKLRVTTRRIWFLRVMLELPSKRIAARPGIGMSPAAVDMALLRSRRSIRGCMLRRGFDPGEMPPGTFALLWDRLQQELGDTDGES